MSLPDRDNPYSFEPFFEDLHAFDFYGDDPFMQRVVAHFAGEEGEDVARRLREFSPKVSFRWRELADAAARPENRPIHEQFDAHNRRVDRLRRSGESLTLEKEIFQEALFSERILPWENIAKRHLLFQLSESSVMCPVACTEGLIALAEHFPDDRHPEVGRIARHCKEGIDGDFGIGAQFMSEIHGGSDIPSNLLEAEPDGDVYRLYGDKFFCSAMHADYSVVTAKVTGSDEVGTFIVPAWLPGNKEKEIRNGYTINRIKWKMGTAELPTAEVSYDGAIAYPVGPTDRGVANAVGIVLTLSRITVGMSSAAGMIRAAREAMLYSQYRDVFGQKICQFPLAAHQIKELIETAQRTTAGAFEISRLFLEQGGRPQPGLQSDEPLEMRKKRFDLRELIIIQKLVAAYDAVDATRKAMSIFGGHGVIEDFISLPRIYRDGAVNELWEGPRNVLLMQVFRDLHRVKDWYAPKEFVASVLEGVDTDLVRELGDRLEDFVARPPFFDLSADTLRRSAEFETLIETLFHVYQTRALNEVGRVALVNKERMAFPELWEAPSDLSGVAGLVAHVPGVGRWIP
jgi:alkylation response protein AidB-like acyl-CoA dehydrogenase